MKAFILKVASGSAAAALAATLAAGMGCTSAAPEKEAVQPLKVSDNRRFLVTKDGKPFFWLGDTGWLLHKLDREQTERYMEDRRAKGFNVIQTSVLHSLNVKNVYGDKAVADMDASKPLLTEGCDPGDSLQYDYWDHVDYAIDVAAQKGMYVAIVAVWGTNVKNGLVSREQAAAYATFLGERYADCTNVIWINGGDVVGADSSETWGIIGNTLREYAPKHLITFHPFGRSRSSEWFHTAPWLDFNMVQSGHRTYGQDPNGIGQDTWRHITVDYSLTPTKPTIDGEPSYENIPHGLHDWHLERYRHLRPKDYSPAASQPLWQADDVRRYAYWSVFAGGMGFTYGHNSVMQMLLPGDSLPGAYGATMLWTDALNAEGALQMQHLKNLMLSRPFLERTPDSSLVANQGERYDHIQATRGKAYALLYTFNGREVQVNMGKIDGREVKVSWYNPRNGELTEVGRVKNEGVAAFTPPSPEVRNGNDWTLILDGI
ncbi:MAG: glycoside hydrolase family 140 protein [Prevotellaceae bacterium]|nr:glycoside hydrolase family 140 protein [Prevotellaceae bacterium]